MVLIPNRVDGLDSNNIAVITYQPVNRADWITISLAATERCERMSAVMCWLFDVVVRKNAVNGDGLVSAFALVIGVNHICSHYCRHLIYLYFSLKGLPCACAHLERKGFLYTLQVFFMPWCRIGDNALVPTDAHSRRFVGAAVWMRPTREMLLVGYVGYSI